MYKSIHVTFSKYLWSVALAILIPILNTTTGSWQQSLFSFYQDDSSFQKTAAAEAAVTFLLLRSQ